MSKQYGSYTDADLNDWQMLPENSRVLTSSAFGAWLLRRDERKGNRDLITEFEKAKAEMEKRRNALDDGNLNDFKKCKMQGYSDSMGILDNRIEELKGEKQ